MAPPTRLNLFRTPSPEPLAGKEATTRRKCKFINKWTNNRGSIPLTRIVCEYGISEACGHKWRDQYLQLGSPSRRRLRPTSTTLGKPSKVTKSMCKLLVSPLRNPYQQQPLKAQIVHFNILVEKCQLQRKLKEHTKGGGHYIIAYINKVISTKNKAQRERYGTNHVWAPLFGFFDHIIYTNEAHIDPTA
jgi:hypothetical protein